MKKLLGAICLVLLMSSPVLALDAGGIQVDVLANSYSSWDGRLLPPYAEGPPEITVLRIQIAPGAQLPLHEHPFINAGVLLRGTLTVITNQNETLHLKAGEAIVEVVDKWHYGRNDGYEPAEIVVFYAGIVGQPINVKQ